MTHTPDNFLPCAEANPSPPVLTLSAPAFAYVGQGLLPQAFTEYVARYDFGRIPPDYVVLHHTAVPDASWAGGTITDTWWDRDEAGMSALQIYNKRNNQLNAIRDYYRDALGWLSGPHLFIDDRWIWLFTPMSVIGTHAKQGNSYRTGGTLHYSIGIEVIGNYARHTWPPSVQQNVAHAVRVLKARLKNFEYIAKPWAGGISAHRHYNKPACPGDQITNDYYIKALQVASPPTKPIFRYIARHTEAIQEAPRADAPVALNDTAQVVEGAVVEVDEVRADGYLHLANGVGFVRKGVFSKL